MTTMVWDETGARYYETGVSKGIFFPIDGSAGVPWNGLVAVSLNPSGGEYEPYYFDGAKYMERILAEDFQATVQAISTPREFEPCEGVKDVNFGMKTHFNKRDKFHMAWRTEIGNDEGVSVAYKIHVAYNCLVQPSARAYQTIADTPTMDTRSFVITATPACGRDSYFTFDSREGDLSDLEAQLQVGVLPHCSELTGLVGPIGGDVIPPDDDTNCPSILTDLEEYFPGQVLDIEVEDDPLPDTDVYIYGKINNGLDVTELPATGAFAANDSAASEEGTGDILADDDDETYITSTDGDLGYTVGLPSLVGYVDGCTFELHIRASITGDISPDDPDNLDASMQVHISTDAGGDDTIVGFSDGAYEGMGFDLTDVSGTPVDYVVPLVLDPWFDSTIDDVVAALNTGAYLNVVGAANNNPDADADPPELRIYEMSVVMLDGTDSGKYLRTDDPEDYGFIEQHIYDPGTFDDVTASITTSVDFMIKQVAYNEDVEGYLAQPIDWPDAMLLQVEPNDQPIPLITADAALGGGPSAPHTHESIVGVSPQWSDGSDATYAEIRAEFGIDHGVAQSLLTNPTTLGIDLDTITAIKYKIRVASDDDADFSVTLVNYKNDVDVLKTGTPISANSPSSDFTDLLIDVPDLEQAKTLLAKPTTIQLVVVTAGVKLRIYEVSLQIEVNAPIIKWYNYDTYDAFYAAMSLGLGVWYTATADWNWTNIRLRIFNRDTEAVLLDHSESVNDLPLQIRPWLNANVDYYCGMVGGTA